MPDTRTDWGIKKKDLDTDRIKLDRKVLDEIWNGRTLVTEGMYSLNVKTMFRKCESKVWFECKDTIEEAP